MPRFAANLSPMYVELPFADRFAAAAADGFTSVECLLPCDHSAEQLAGIAPAGMETQRLRAIYLVNLEVQMDLYHLQIAGVSQRQEPDIGELNYAHRFDLIDEVSAACSWEDWVGCEYRPRLGGQPRGTSAGLGWLQRARTLR